MIKKDTFTKIAKDVKDLKDKATRIGQETAKNAANVKQAVQTGVSTSKNVLDKASKVLNRGKVSQGIKVASEGVSIAAKGTRTIADTMEKASRGMKKLSDTLKK